MYGVLLGPEGLRAEHLVRTAALQRAFRGGRGGGGGWWRAARRDRPRSAEAEAVPVPRAVGEASPGAGGRLLPAPRTPVGVGTPQDG